MFRSSFLPAMLALFIIGIANVPIRNAVVVNNELSGRPVTTFFRRPVISCTPPAYVPTDFLRMTIGKKNGIGLINFPITVANQTAQDFFNQGVAFEYNFEYVQSTRSFYTALQYDSSSAMIYWGLSNAYSSLDDSTESRVLAAKAQSLSGGIKPEEKMLIRLLVLKLTGVYDSAGIAQHRKLLQATSDSANLLFPDNAEIWRFTGLLRAFRYTGPVNESAPAAARYAIDHYISKSLEIEPTHFGAWHYLIHLTEATSQFDKALEYGRLYTTAAPQIPHAWHMYAHDLMKTGHVTDAIEKFKYAFELEQKKYVTENMPKQYDWHHAHNMELLAYCYQYKGQFEKAEKLFFILDTLTPSMSAREAQVRKGHPYYYLQINEPGKAKLLAAPLVAGKHEITRFTGYFIRGLSEVFTRDTVAAKNSYAEMVHIIDSLKNISILEGTPPDVAEDDYGYMYARAGIVQMGIQMVRDSKDQQVMAKMNGIQKTLLKQTGPDPWIDALYFLQLLTQMSINSGNLTLAESSAKNILQHDPGYPGAFLLMARIKKAQGELAKAASWMAKAKAGYRDADKDFLRTLKL